MGFGREPEREEPGQGNDGAMGKVDDTHDAENQVEPLSEKNVCPAQEHAVDDQLQ